MIYNYVSRYIVKKFPKFSDMGCSYSRELCVILKGLYSMVFRYRESHGEPLSSGIVSGIWYSEHCVVCPRDPFSFFPRSKTCVKIRIDRRAVVGAHVMKS